MKSTNALVAEIISRLKKAGFAQGRRNKFGFVSESESFVMISRENGLDTKIPHNKIAEAIVAFRKDHKVYSEGPSRLRIHGLTHITSPLWALLHLLTLEELKA